MKVAYITHNSDPLSGASKALLSLLRVLRTRGVEPYVITTDQTGIYQLWAQEGFHMIALDYRPCTYPPLRNWKDYLLFPVRTLGRIYLAHRAATQLKDIVLREHIDIIHSNTSVVSIGRDTANMAGIPHVYHFREYGDIDFGFHYIPGWRSFHRKTRQSLNLCITQNIRHHHFGASGSHRTAVIYDGVLPAQAEPTYSTDSHFFIIAGRVEPAKGFDFALRGYCDYVQKVDHPIPLKIVGRESDPVYSHQLRTFIKANQLTEHVQFIGQSSELNRLMQQATATIIASPFEGFGFVMAEAMFNGCLVVGRDTAGTNEQFENGLAHNGQEIGLRFLTEEQLSTHLQAIHQAKPDQWLSMKQLAFQTVNTLYTAEHCAEEVLNHYSSLIK